MNKPIYIVSQGDGLKSHLSTDPEGDRAICGHKIEHYNKKVRKVKQNDMLFMLIGCCKRCLKTAGLEE